MLRRVLLIVLALLIVLGGFLGYRAYEIYAGVSNITGKTVARATGEPTVVLPSFTGTKRINFLLLGSDNDQKVESAAPLTQSMIVVTVDPVDNKVGILSIPRDFWVPISGHGYRKIDLAFSYGYRNGGMDGGVRLARQTIEQLFGISVDYYGWVGLIGFSKVIDTFNGVTLDVQHPILDDTYPNDINSPDPYGSRRLFFPAGLQHMDGNSALEYVRSRHGDIHSDFGRSNRQQQVLLQLRQKINAVSILTKLPELVSELQNSVRTDLTPQQLYQLDALSHRIPKGNVTRLVLQAPTYCYYDTSPDGESILRPYWNKILPKVRSMFAPVRPPAGHVATIGPGKPSATPRGSVTPAPTARPLPTLTSTPVPRSISRLPGSLVYVRDTQKGSEDGNIYQLGRDGETTQLTYSGDGAMPLFSPDGRTLAFVRFTDGLHKYDKYASDVWLMDLATRRQHPVTQDENSGEANNLWAAWPVFSPDGKQILFATDRAKLASQPSDARATDLAIWSMSVDGTHLTQLTTPSQGAGGDTDPVWRPGSREFAYVAWRYPSEAAGTPESQLVLEEADSRTSHPLTAQGQSVLQPTWSPNGASLAYLQRVGGSDQLITARLTTTSGQPRLTGGHVLATGNLAQPAFTPDGKWISFLRAEGDGFSLYLVNVATGTERIVSGVDGQIDARWRPVWGR